jgi:hypothetical protein
MEKVKTMLQHISGELCSAKEILYAELSAQKPNAPAKPLAQAILLLASAEGSVEMARELLAKLDSPKCTDCQDTGLIGPISGRGYHFCTCSEGNELHQTTVDYVKELDNDAEGDS